MTHTALADRARNDHDRQDRRPGPRARPVGAGPGRDHDQSSLPSDVAAQRAITALDGLSARDRALFRSYGWGPEVEVPTTGIHHAIIEHARATPEVVAVEHLGESITYGELDRQSDRLARWLATEGVLPGDNVGLFVHRSVAMVVGIVAILKTGAAYVPQDVRVAPRSQLEHVARTARTGVILTLADAERTVPVPDGARMLAVDRFMQLGHGATHEPQDRFTPARPVDGGDGCYVLFTSGTTGTPNGVTVTHRNVCNILLTAPGDLGIRPGWRVAQILNVAFDMAAWEILGALSHGATLVVRGDDITEAVSTADVVIATPTVLGTVDLTRCGGVRVAAVAGEPCPRPLADRWASTCTFYNACGPTETTIVNTMQRHDPAAIRLSIGRPTPNNTVYVLDDDLRPVAIGETGEMWAGGDCVSAGYLANAALDAERYADDPFLGGGRRMFRTRDLGRWTPDGELEHLGRTDDQVKVRGGFRVELDCVSAVLEQTPGCEQAVTIKVDDHLVAFLAPNGVDVSAAAALVAERLPYYCSPTAIHPLPSLPLTSRGKIDKALLLDRARALEARAGRADRASGQAVAS